MHSAVLSLASAAVILLLGAPALAQLPKPVLFSDGLSPHVEQSFWDNLVPVESTWIWWTGNDIPQRCKEEAEYLGLNPVDFDIYSIKYVDCDTSWFICRHKNAVLTRPVMTNLFGRIPVHERQWIQHIMAAPATNGNWAYIRSAVAVFVGNVGVPSVFQHEIGHAMDAYNNAVGSSPTTTWDTAIRNDTCVPDDYANTSKAEDYAQNSVLLLYEIVTPSHLNPLKPPSLEMSLLTSRSHRGGLDKIGSWRCLQWQYRAVRAFQRPATIPGGKCERRWANSPIVPKAGTTLLKSVTSGPETLEAAEFTAGSSVPTFGLPPADETEPHVDRFKNPVFNKAAELEAIELEESWDRKARIKRMHIARAA